MKVEYVGLMNVEDRFLYWIQERHHIYLKKKRGKAKPWTDDSILQNYWFTNPYREHDKVTVWVEKNIREPFADHPNLWFMLCIARYINRPDTLQEMMDKNVWPTGNSWKAVKAGNVLDAIMARGERVYTAAYMIRAEAYKDKPWYSWSKQQYITQIVLGSVWKRRKSFHPSTIEEACWWLRKSMGWGGFMAYEVASDLRHTRYLDNAPDIMTWANPGPGARRGLNRVHERELHDYLLDTQAVEEMRALLTKCQRILKRATYPKFEMREVEHSLCEFDKYERLRLGQGRSKRRYNGID